MHLEGSPRKRRRGHRKVRWGRKRWAELLSPRGRSESPCRAPSRVSSLKGRRLGISTPAQVSLPCELASGYCLARRAFQRARRVSWPPEEALRHSGVSPTGLGSSRPGRATVSVSYIDFVSKGTVTFPQTGRTTKEGIQILAQGFKAL